MNYTKPALSFHDQAKLLITRGMLVKDSQDLETYLQQVNYYRLSGYWYIFKTTDPVSGEEKLKPGTTFEMIRNHYEFDRRLRLLIMDAIERIEVSIFRTRMVEIHTTHYGPFGYTQQNTYNPKYPSADLQNLLRDIFEDERRSHEEFIHRYRLKYTSERYLPFWMVAELMSFGQLLTLYRNLDLSLKKTLAHQFNLYPMVLDSWLLTLNYIRNSCAHHARLWNRPLPLAVKRPDPKHDSQWYKPVQIPNNNIFSVLTLIQYLLNFILPHNTWKDDVKHLLTSYPGISIRLMGFPQAWQDSPLWK